MSTARSWLLVAAVLLLAALCYSPARQFGFVHDAYWAVEHNPVVARGSVTELFGSHYWTGSPFPDRSLYRPVTLLTFALEHRLTGRPDAARSHLINIALHAATALLLAAYLRRLGSCARCAAAGALIFTCHPALLQAVTDLVGRAEILATLFTLGALYLAWNGEPARSPTRGRALVRRIGPWAAGLCLFLALGSKESGMAAVLLVVAQAVLFPAPPADRRGRLLDRVAALAPAALAVTLYLVLRTLAIEAFPGVQPIRPMDNVLLGLTGAERWFTTLAMAGRYTTLLLWPASLSADYSGLAIRPVASLLQPYALLGLGTLVGLVFLAVRPWHSRFRTDAARRTAMAALLALVPWMIYGNAVVLNGAGYAERLVYPSAAGFCALLGLMVGRLVKIVRAWDRRLVALAAMLGGAVLFAAVTQTRTQSEMWRDGQSLWERTLSVTPDSVRAYYELAAIRRAQGGQDEALALYSESVRRMPDHPTAWVFRGAILGQRGELNKAEASLRTALRLRPDSGEALTYLGLVLARQGRSAEAERSLRKALRHLPGQVTAAAQLAHLLFEDARYAEAARWYGRAVAGGRDDLRPRLDEANMLIQQTAIE